MTSGIDTALARGVGVRGVTQTAVLGETLEAAEQVARLVYADRGQASVRPF